MRALIACEWGSLLAVSAHHSLVGGCGIRGCLSFVRGGCCHPWAVRWLLSLGAVCCGCWVVVGGHQVTLLWVGRLLFVGSGSHCGCWVFVGAGSLFADPGQWGLCVVSIVCGWQVVVRGQVVHGLGCGLWVWWCCVMCCVFMVSKIGWDEWGQGTHCCS